MTLQIKPVTPHDFRSTSVFRDNRGLLATYYYDDNGVLREAARPKNEAHKNVLDRILDTITATKSTTRVTGICSSPEIMREAIYKFEQPSPAMKNDRLFIITADRKKYLLHICPVEAVFAVYIHIDP